jgi:hypothetical protein
MYLARPKMKSFLAVLLVLVSGGAVLGETTSGTGTLRMQFVDSRSGVAVRPQAVLIDGKQASAMPDESGLLSLPGIPDGSHEVQVEAENYQPFSATATVEGDNSLVQTFEIDPVKADDEATTPSMTEAIIQGTVVDDLHGAPVIGAELKVSGVPSSSLSNDRGKFLLQFVPPAGEGSRSTPRVTLNVSHAEYVSQQFRDVEASRGSIQRMVVRLRRTAEAEPGDDLTSAPQVINQGRPLGGNRNYQWTFDATLR